MNQDYHVFQGMRQDNPPIRQNTNFLCDAYNIRLTNKGIDLANLVWKEFV